MQDVRCGFLNGNGAATNVSLGFIPDVVWLINLTDGDKIFISPLAKHCAFTSGGTFEIKRGHKIKGVTSGATARIKEVVTHLSSGTYAAGDAAGFLVLEDIVGTWGAEVAYVTEPASGTADDLTLSAAPAIAGVDVDTEVAGTTTGGLAAYAGSSTPGSEAAPGFTIPSVSFENDKLWFFVAFRNSGGGDTKATAA